MLELNMAGIFVPALLVWAGLAFLLSRLIDRMLSRTSFWRVIWHRGLFDVALWVLLWGALSAGAYHSAFAWP